MPSYNQGEYIEQAIRSILNQEGDFSIELIICDGGSTDSTLETIGKYDQLLAGGRWPLRCRHLELIWHSQEDGGQYQAINQGMNQARGKYLAWLNSDDLYTPWAFSVINDVFLNFPEFEWLVGMYPLFFNKDGQCIGTERRPGYRAGSYRRGVNLPGQSWYARWFIQQDSVFWRRELWAKSGGLDTRFPLAADFALWLRFFEFGEPATVSSPLSGYRIHPDQKTADQDRYDRDAEAVLQDYIGPNFAGGPLTRAMAPVARRLVRRLAPIPGLGRTFKWMGLAEKVSTIVDTGRSGGWHKKSEFIF